MGGFEVWSGESIDRQDMLRMIPKFGTYHSSPKPYVPHGFGVVYRLMATLTLLVCHFFHIHPDNTLKGD